MTAPKSRKHFKRGGNRTRSAAPSVGGATDALVRSILKNTKDRVNAASVRFRRAERASSTAEREIERIGKSPSAKNAETMVLLAKAKEYADQNATSEAQSMMGPINDIATEMTQQLISSARSQTELLRAAKKIAERTNASTTDIVSADVRELKEDLRSSIAKLAKTSPQRRVHATRASHPAGESPLAMFGMSPRRTRRSRSPASLEQSILKDIIVNTETKIGELETIKNEVHAANRVNIDHLESILAPASQQGGVSAATTTKNAAMNLLYNPKYSVMDNTFIWIRRIIWISTLTAAGGIGVYGFIHHGDAAGPPHAGKVGDDRNTNFTNHVATGPANDARVNVNRDENFSAAAMSGYSAADGEPVDRTWNFTNDVATGPPGDAVFNTNRDENFSAAALSAHSAADDPLAPGVVPGYSGDVTANRNENFSAAAMGAHSAYVSPSSLAQSTFDNQYATESSAVHQLQNQSQALQSEINTSQNKLDYNWGMTHAQRSAETAHLNALQDQKHQVDAAIANETKVMNHMKLGDPHNATGPVNDARVAMSVNESTADNKLTAAQSQYNIAYQNLENAKQAASTTPSSSSTDYSSDGFTDYSQSTGNDWYTNGLHNQQVASAQSAFDAANARLASVQSEHDSMVASLPGQGVEGPPNSARVGVDVVQSTINNAFNSTPAANALNPQSYSANLAHDGTNIDAAPQAGTSANIASDGTIIDAVPATGSSANIASDGTIINAAPSFGSSANIASDGTIIDATHGNDYNANKNGLNQTIDATNGKTPKPLNMNRGRGTSPISGE